MKATIRVLVVDDNKYLADVLCSALVLHEDIHIIGACNSGAEALEVLQRRQVDVMLLDIIMPNMDGLQVLAHMSAGDMHKPAVILLTAIGNDEILQKASALGADSFLTKPVTADVIVQRIRTVFKDRHPLSVETDV